MKHNIQPMIRLNLRQYNKTIIGRLQKNRPISSIVLLSLVLQLVYPSVAIAVTSGPSSPEFSSFEPIATTNMVNEFSGQFIYNLPVLEIPGASGGGYALSLSYHGGDGPEAEASWVGHGWTLNPGSILRNRKGIPDDYNGLSCINYNTVPDNWTVAATANLSMQMFSVTGSLSSTVRYNYYKGFGITSGVGLSALKGLFSLNYANTDGTGYFSAAVNPASLLSYVNNGEKTDMENAYAQMTCEYPKKGLQGSGQAALGMVGSRVGSVMTAGISSYVNYMLVSSSSPYNLTPYSGESYQGYVSTTTDPGPVPIGGNVGVNITYINQHNSGTNITPAVGYMYSGNSDSRFGNDSASGSAIMDYTVENASTYNKRDMYLSVPTSTPDAFMVSGEGLSGSFRMYNDRIGIFSPNYVESSTDEKYFGADIHLGQNVGLGGDITLKGFHDLKVKSSWHDGNGNTDSLWFVPYNYYDSTRLVSENMFFRFNNDLGGKVEYMDDNGNIPLTASVDGNEPMMPTGNGLKIRKDTSLPSNANRRSARASYIGYHTNRELTTFIGSKRPLAYEQREDIHILAGRGDSIMNWQLRDEIGEVSIVNEGGNRYTYGLPVYTGGERSLRRGITSSSDKYLVHSSVNDTKVGELYDAPYASQYLLTEITTPDYLDINANGPDEVDFGGYTKFSYKQLVGTTNKIAYSGWYKWRSPYSGYSFVPNRLSDKTDDMGAFQSGYREIYYLDTIQTKTHYAVFILDSRQDCRDAHANDDVAGAIAGSTGSSPLLTRKLKEIQLYAKSSVSGGVDQLIKTIHFEYDYSIWPGNPNTVPAGAGKLTLKKVWFEYNGVVNARISPYQFEYTYPTGVTYPSQYSFIQSEMGSLSQTPMYTPYMDCWGNYMDNGYARRQKYKNFVPQAPSPAFDPAAYQLKRIILPSGGEIHVQYEQHTYSHVQDRKAHALVSLNSDDWAVANGDDYALNTSELGINTDAEKDSLVALVNRTCRKQKIFFKFFYTLVGTSTADIGNCNGDYVEGYVNFDTCYKSGTGLSAAVMVKVDGLPRQVCKDYVRYEIGGKLFGASSCDAELPGPLGSGVEAGLKSLAPMFIKKVLSGMPGANICMRAKGEVSYLRLPIPRKKGGGIRVKRLLMYNKGIDVNSPTLYGTQYIYDNESDGTSYGVATNEPFENKGENPLVTFLPKRGEQSDWDRLIAGKDREKFEGPMSWNVLPAPSIGYSRVIKRNIFQSNATGTGYTVIDYNTVRDYPFDMYYSALGVPGINKSDVQHIKDKWSIDFGILDYSINTGMKSAQGYCFIQNQMHGQIRQISDYRCKWDPVKFYNIANPPVPVSQKTYSYFDPGERIPMYDYDTWSVYYDQPGKETDITIDRRCVEEHSEAQRRTGDLTTGLVFGVPTILYPIAFPVNSESNQRMSSIVVNKVIHYPAIMKQMTVMKDGYYQVSDYAAFDPLTTKPVQTRTYDGFHKVPLSQEGYYRHNGTYTAYNVPASACYPQMGQKAWNERYYYIDSSGISVAAAGLGIYSVSGVNPVGGFAVGDLIALQTHTTGSAFNVIELAHVVKLSGVDIMVTPALRYNATLTPSTSGCIKVEVVSSNHTNQLASSMDGFTEYGGETDLSVFLAQFNHIISSIQTSTLTNDSLSLDMSHFGFHFRIGPDGTCGREDWITKFVVRKTGSTFTIVSRYNLGAAEVGIGWTWPIPTPVTITAGYGWGGGWTTLFATTPGGEPPTQLRPVICDKYKNIVKAQATYYNDKWVYDTSYGIDTTALNHWESGMEGKWRPFETWVYRDTIINGSKPIDGQRNYFAGVTPFTLGRWDTISNVMPEKWIRSNHINKYSPNGNATEEFDAENVFSAAKYGYHGLLPYIVAQNSKTEAVLFESFENVYPLGVNFATEDRMIVDPADIKREKHTGSYSYNRDPTEKIILPKVVCPPFKKLTVRYWAKIQGSPTSIFGISASPSSGPMPATYIARSGAWALYEAVWTSFSGAPTPVEITIQNNASHAVLFDDIRIQPTEAKATSYVYDVGTYKLSAVLDDQHFATYYQYNGEGKLVRTLVETERGIKTVEESQYHTPTIPR